MRTRGFLWLTLAILFTLAGHAASAQLSPADAEFFEKRIRPLLAEKCYSCHSAASKPPMGGLRLDTRAGMLQGGSRGGLLKSGPPENSLLIRSVRYADKSLQMPPKGRLSEEQIAMLLDWVRRGAPWPAQNAAAAPAPTGSSFDLKARAKHWAWQPVRRPAIPVVKLKSWPQNPLDAFVLAKLEARGMTPAPPTDKATLLRRVTYDLIGLPPTPAEIHAFLADTSPNAYEKVVDRLLASPHYGERWARHWLDLVRYAETDGHEWDIEKVGAYQYRDYLIRALNADVPYDQFVTEQIAGDLLPHPRLNPTEQFNESMLGTGFFWLGAGKHSPVDLRDDEAERVDNQIDVLGKAFLGMGLGCARCHDHKFDAITTKDYYALYGFLKSTRLQAALVGPPLASNRRQELQTLHDSLQQSLRQNAAAALIRAADLTTPETDARLKQAQNTPTDPFYPWTVLSTEAANRSAEAFAQTRAELIKQLQAMAERSRRETQAIPWLADFSAKGAYQGWTATGEAFASALTAALSARLEGDRDPHVRLSLHSGVADSGTLADRLQGTLRSPTFTITKPNILYHIAAQNARIRLILHGYQRLRDPLYSRLEIEVKSPDRMTWITQDVHDWIGLEAYIEIVDGGAGAVAFDKVGFADSGPPSESPNPLLLQMLDDPALTSLDALKQKTAALFRQVATAAVGNHPLNVPDAHAREDLLLWALQTASLSSSDSQHLADLLKQRSDLEALLSSPQPALAAIDGNGENEPVHLRGNYRTAGPVVPRRFLEVCDPAAPLASVEGSGRLQLAQRITAPNDPLLARVLVNRLWQHHFGEGIVRTPDDFGVMGERPTHPELLDYLASELVRQGWSLKKMHRIMVLSSTYRMASQAPVKAEEVDPQNRLLHRMPVRRLEAECIRDAILAASGRLDPQLYGPPVMPNLNAFTPGRGAPPSGPLDGAGRRSIYISIRRNFPIPMFTAFDYPVPVTTAGRRSVSNVPAQALTLLNDPFVVEQAQVWAKRLLTTPGTPEQRMTLLYETAFGRPPRPFERDAALAFLTTQAKEYGSPDDPRTWADLCHVLFNVKEFIFLH